MKIINVNGRYLNLSVFMMAIDLMNKEKDQKVKKQLLDAVSFITGPKKAKGRAA